MKRMHDDHLTMVWMAMVMTIAIGLILACASSKPSMLPYDEAASQWDATVDKHIPDAQRADKVKELGRQLDDLQASLSADIDALKEQFIALNANYASTENEMWQLVRGFESKRKAALDEYREIIFAMRREVSQKEWKAMID